MIDIILIEPETSGNVGAVARVMKNFGLKSLVLVNPLADKDSDEAMNRAKHAKDVLRKAKVADFNILDKYDYLIGTSGKLGGDYNIPRCTLNPQELAVKVSRIKRKVGLVFGREGKGLFNTEIEKCDFLVNIPADKKYPILNLSHSVAIVLYELNKKMGKDNGGDNIVPISKKEKDVLLDMIDGKLKDMDFQTRFKRETQLTVWKKVIGKSMLTKREAFALLGFFRKLK